jgi:hypothetical protein
VMRARESARPRCRPAGPRRPRAHGEGDARVVASQAHKKPFVTPRWPGRGPEEESISNSILAGKGSRSGVFDYNVN